MVTTNVDAARVQKLPNNRAVWAVQNNESGVVADDVYLQHLSIELNRMAEREQAFQQLLEDQQNPASPSFHQWLTPVEIGERYGASQNDIDAVANWVRSQGMTVEQISNSRTRIIVNGTAGAVSNAKTQLRYYTVGAEQLIGNAEDPQIPVSPSPHSISEVWRLNGTTHSDAQGGPKSFIGP